MADPRMIASTIILLASLGGLAPSASAQEVTEEATVEITGTVVETCRNYKVIECWCKEACKEKKSLGTFRVDPGTDPDEYCKAMFSDCGSLIDNMTFNHIHWAHDWKLASAAGCTPCGGSSGSSGSGLPELSLKRTHRFRDIAEISSLGPGVFFDHDISVSFEWQR